MPTAEEFSTTSVERRTELLGMPDVTLLSGACAQSRDVISAAVPGTKSLFDRDTQNAPSVAHLFGFDIQCVLRHITYL